MSALLQDLRYGLRMLAKNPGFTAVAVLTLALGIGANTAIFSVVDAVLLRPLPYQDPDRLVMLWEQDPSRGLEREPVSGPDFIDWQRQNGVFENLAGWARWMGSADFNLTSATGVEKVTGSYVSSSLFPLLGVDPLLGRTFLPGEDRWQGNRVAILGYELWQRRFAHDGNIIGKTITTDSYGRRDYTVVGVMPPGFGFPNQCELWLPAGWTGVHLDERRSAHWYQVIARLRRGVTVAQAQAAMNTVQAHIAQEHPNDLIGPQVAVVPLREATVGRNLHLALLVLWAVVACVLLIACANVANLSLVRAAARQREIALRLAVGASRWRVMRQLFTESVLLALLGGMLGVLLAFWSLHWIIAAKAGDIPRIQHVRIDLDSLVFTFLICFITGVLFGLAPAWRFSNPDLDETLRDSSRATGGVQGTRFRNVLIVSEIALSFVLLIGAGLMAKSFMRLLRVNRGFQPDHLLTAHLDFSVSGFTTWVEPTSTRPQVTLEQIVQGVRNQSRVRSVAAVSDLHIGRRDDPLQPFVIEHRQPAASGEFPTASFLGITPDYFRTMDIPLLHGRSFSESDVYGGPGVVIINERMAKRYFPHENPIGKRLALGSQKKPGQPAREPSPWSEIIGVVGDVKSLSSTPEAVPQIYRSYWQWPMQSPTLLVRTASDPANIAAVVRSEVKGVNRNLPAPTIRSMDEILADTVAQPRFQSFLLSLFGVVALVLAAVGIYGVMAYNVAQRMREIGIRIALGARRQDAVTLVMGQAVILTLAGIGLGLLGAFVLTRFLATLLYSVRPTDPATFLTVAVVLASASSLASYIPARRATRVDPIVALRHE